MDDHTPQSLVAPFQDDTISQGTMTTDSEHTDGAIQVPDFSSPSITVTCTYASMFENDEAAQFDATVVLFFPDATEKQQAALNQVQEGVERLLINRRAELVLGFQRKKTLPYPRLWAQQWSPICKSAMDEAIEGNGLDDGVQAAELRGELKAMNPQCRVQVHGWDASDAQSQAERIQRSWTGTLSEEAQDWQEVCQLGYLLLNDCGESVTPRGPLRPNAPVKTQTDSSLVSEQAEGPRNGSDYNSSQESS